MKRDFTTFLAAAEQGHSCPRGNPDSLVGYDDRNVHVPFGQASVWTLILFFALTANFTLAADPVPPKQTAPAATQRELWVPTEHLQSVLKNMPRAVMLTPEQYDLLLRDSQLATADPALAALAKQKPPVKVTVRETRFSGEITVGGDVVVMTADYVVESFTDQWAEIPLVLHRGRLAHIEVDAKSALRVAKPAGGGQIQPLLVVKGRGKHSVRAVYHIPVMRSPTGNSILVPSPGTAAASLILKAPPGAELDSALPFTRKVKPGSESDGNVPAAVGEVDEYHFVLPAQQNQNFEIRWTARNVAEIPDAAVFQNCQYLYSIDSTRIQADLGFVLNSNLTKLPNRFVITFPEEVRVLSVEGSELLRWTRVAGDAIEIILVPGERDVADLRILAEADVTIPEAGDEETEDATMTLPVANVVGIHRASGTMAIIGSDDVRVKNIATGPLTAPIPDDIEGAIANAPFYVAAFRFPVATVPPTVTLSRIGEKYKAQLDTLIALERESVQLTRTLNVIPDEGRTFEIDFTLPEGEELLDVADGNRADFSWVRGEGNSVQLSWKAGLSVGAGDTLTITSRRDPEGWFALGEEAMPLSFASATIDGAEALSGYVAASFNESFRVETVTSEGLDPRDGRTTPVTGTLAWFRLSDYNLTLNASRRATEIEAAHTAYALPLASTLELEGQVDLAIRYTPIGEIVIEFPPAVAAQARFESPLIAQKNLDAETGAWTLDFHDELIGPQQIRYRMSLPFEVEEIGKDSDQKRFEISLPVVKIPAAKRLRGEWVMEANTDTELEFVANGLDAVDSLRVPQISGYQPRHRVIAAYRYRGDAWSLKLAGTRHAHAELVSTVIDSLRLDTVVSTDGDDRHQAIMSLRTTGEQFLDIGLPQDAVLWTLKVDGETVKPIRADPGTLRIQLPAHEDAGDRAITLKLIYETPGREWGGSGKEKLQPIRVADRIPVMQTQWLLHLPEGYDYQKFETNLSEEFEVVDRTLLGVVGDEVGRRLEHLSPLRMIAANSEEAGMAWGLMDDEKNEYPVQSAAVDFDEGFERQTTRPQLTDAQTEQKLKNIILASVEFVDTPLSEALQFLQQRSSELDLSTDNPAEKGMNFILDSRAVISNRGFEESEYDPTGRRSIDQLVASNADKARVTLRLRNIPIGEALKYTVSQANMKYIVENSNVLIVPEDYNPVVVTRRYKVPKNFMEMANSGGGGSGGGAAADPFADPEPISPQPQKAPSAREIFEQAGVTFPRGGTAEFDEATGELLLKSTGDQIELAEIYLDTLTDSNLTGADSLGSTDSETDRVVLNEQRLNNIILPSVEFVDTPLVDALNFLQQRSAELDASTDDPTQKGINMVLDPGTASGGFNAGSPEGDQSDFGVGGGVEDTRITLRLQDVPLAEALRYTASLAQMKYKVEPNAVVIVPLSRPDDNLYTNTYTIPPGFLNPAIGGNSESGRLMSAQEVLESAGVTFPPGGSAFFNPRTNQLVVRTTQDQLELADDYFEIDHGPSPDETSIGNTNGGAVRLPDLDESPPEFPQLGNSNQTAQFFGQKALDQINPNWRDVPVMNQAPQIEQLFQRDEVVEDKNQKVLGELTINDLDLNGKTVEEALALIREKTLADTGETTPPVGAHSATSRSKLVKFILVEKADPEPSGVDPALKNKLDLNLSNVTVLEALDQIEDVSNTHFRVTSDGILFATKAVSLEPMQTIFMELPESEFRMSDGNGEMQAAHARGVLSEAGIKFPVGSSAAYNPSTGRLAVRNTRPNLEAIASLYSKFLNVEAQQAQAAARAEKFEQEFLGGAADLKGFDLADIGRLPIDFALPESGRSYAFSGLYAPEQIEFRFVNWERQIRFAWIWILVGGLAFWFGAYRRLGRPVFLGLLGVVVLTFVPLVISKSLLAFCNALLIGWLVAGVIWVVWRISVKSAAKTEEVAV